MGKVLIITGPTATGKTALGVKLAKIFNGEIISADSRQVYKFMDIGTGKDLSEYGQVKYWGIDLVEPDYPFNVSDFVKYASTVITDIQARGKLPIIVGGTALYIKALLEPIETINIPVNHKMRESFKNLSVPELQKILQIHDINKWKKLNSSDQQNPRRLVRAIEVASSNLPIHTNSPIASNIFLVGLTAPWDYLYNQIDQRVEKRIKQGMSLEIKNLLARGYSWNLPSMSGFGYQQFKNNSLSDAPLKWKTAEHAYAKRQLTFLKKFFREESERGIRTIWHDICQINSPDLINILQEEIAKWYSESQ